ncbi:unnamed protein product, partial [Closterium sp. Naga37s-1]
FLSVNSLSGPVPASIGNLLGLESLHLHRNNLSGTIPPSIGSLVYLKKFTTWGTNLTCPANYTSCVQNQTVWTAFCRKCPSFCATCLNSTASTNTTSNTTSNTNSSSSSEPDSATSGGSSGLPLGTIIGIVVASVVLLLLLLLTAVLLYLRHKRQQKSPRATLTHQAATVGTLAGLKSAELSLAEVEAATNNWSVENQLGSGAFGDVYKGVSPRDGVTDWAVKRAKLLVVDFQRELQQMADKNHPNIVRLLGFAVGGDMRTRPEQVLIYEFVSNGDLEKWLDPT